MNRNIHYIIIALLLQFGAATTVFAQTITGNIYGGGEMAKVTDNTNVTINTGLFGGSIFGGGEGKLNNDGTVSMSADIGTHNDDGTLVENTGDTHVTINGGEIVYSVGEEDNLRNIYGGGNLACNVAGSTYVAMTKGMITTYSFTSSPLATAAWRYFYDNSMKPNQQKIPICSVFGAGYGAHTDVAGFTNVDINITGTADIQPADGVDFTHDELEAIDRFALRLKPDTKMSAQFVPVVHGGGFDGTVGAYDPTTKGIKYDKTSYESQTNVTIKGQPFVFNVFGGGLGSKSGADATGGVDSYVGAVYGATKVDIQGGIINGDVFGGGAGIESEKDIPNPFTGVGTVKMPYTYAAQVMRETDVTISGNTTVIFGNVYGGGDIANTGWYVAGARPTMTDHVAQQNQSLAILDYTTSLKLNGGNVLGSVFGGGNGRTKAQMLMSMFVGTVCGSTNVALNGTKVWSHVYGGGNMGTVFKCETIAASKGESGRTMATGVIDGCTNVAVLNGMVAKDIFGGGYGDNPNTGDANVTSADIYGNTYVYFEKADLEYAKYWKSRTFLPSDATNEQMLAEVTGKFLDQSSADDKRNTESDITHNLYGGGNMACDVKGNTHVYMIGAPTAPADFSTTDYYKECIANVAKPHFSVFGGGFGDKAMVTGNAYSDINLHSGTGLHSIVGGGLNGSVEGMCNVHVGNDPQSLIHFVYGGGYYAPCAGTKLDITRGTILENVYGGAVMGDINALGASTDVATNTTIGLKSEGDGSSVVFKDEFDNTLRSYTYAVHQNQITIYGDVYGANDVSGTVNGIAKLTVNGGEFKSNVFGAGNGDHTGYYEPGRGHYNDGVHDNYYLVDHSGETSTDGKNTVGPKGLTYKGRPQTIGGVELKLEGNSDTDRVKVLGQVFGGGNSCTIGSWDKTMLAPEGKYHGDPHLVRDDPDYFLGGGQLHITLGSHVKIGRSHKELVDANDEEYLNKDGENVSGLFMGCSGRHLATQETAEDDYFYHHYYDRYTAKYWPGFAVFADNGTPLSREDGLKSFNAYLNNILVWSDDVTLTIDDEAEDIWLANFVGGGFRGSMKAKTAAGRFAYTLPEGVTVGNAVVGGAYNTDVVYRVYDTEDDMHTYKTTTIADKTHFIYRTTLKPEWTQGTDYHHVEYAEDGTTPTGIIRFYYDGGILSHDNSNARIHQVHADPRANDANYATAYFEPMSSGDDMEDEATKAKLFTKNKDKSFVYLNLRCALEPEVLVDSENNHSVHGGNVFGGCFMSGLVQGDSWVDYGAWLSPNCTDTYYFDKSNNMHIYSEAADLVRNNALNVFGAGYGENTHTAGDTYLYIKSVAQDAGGDGNKNGKFPYMFNAFGGSYAGRVYGNTNVYYASGKQGTLLGSLYGGGFKGDIDGNTFVELAEGFVTNVYGGSRQANIGGASHVWAYDGKSRGIDDANHLIICNVYGGNDIAGTINGTMPAAFTATKWSEIEDKKFNSYVEISADDGSANRGFPLVGSAYAGGNGVNWAEGLGAQPTVGTALIEIEGGSTLRAFGGGNMATVTADTYIFTNASSTTFADVTFSEYQTNIMKKVFFDGVTSGYSWEANTTDGKLTRLVMDPFHVANIFGGNNLATMTIQPTWNLLKGKIENVYSGGNMGDMTYYNPSPATGKSKGLSITVDSDDIFIESLYGGCRMSDVRATLYTKDTDGNILSATPQTFAEDDYGATVNVKAGYINNVYGGNDISGNVYNGTNVNISGAVSGNVYGSGNGDYFYVWDKDVTKVTEVYVEKDRYSYFKVPKYYGGEGANDAEKILTINHWRPSVNKAYLNISGTPEKVAYVKGNVYCGGNASTVEGENAHTKFDIGSYVTLNGVFMGSDGAEFSTKDNISRFETLNGFNMTDDVTWPASWTDDEGNACAAAVTDAEKDFYPSMLSLYMKAVEMKALPQGFQASLNVARSNAYIGVFCGGGNRGSMTIGETVNMTIPNSLTIYDKVVAGCLDANVTYKNGTKEVTSIGGYYRPMTTSERTKLKYTVESQFKPLLMDVPADMSSNNEHGEDFATAKAKGFLYPNTGTAKVKNVDVPVYNVGCNIYGGCYHSGDVLGDVVLNVKSSMLAEPLRTSDNRTLLNNTVDAVIAAFNVYGAGFDMESHVYGNVHITLDNTDGDGNLPTFDKLTCPSASNINGGGRSGYLYGNSYINVLNGIVYNNVIGGSDAGYQYGSSHIAVGDPVMYECRTQGDYTLDRADKWNEDKVNHDGTHPVTKSMKLMVGDRVSEAVYNKISDSEHSKFTACYVPGSAEGSRLKWTNRKIHIGAGIYAGGFALATGSSIFAGDYTVRRLTAENRWKDAFTGAAAGEIGYAGNANIMIADDPLNATSGTKDHITISTIVDREKSGMKSKMGYFTRTDTHTTDALGDPIYSYDHQSDGVPDGGTTYYELSGEGGIYGDGHLSFVEGFRSADIQRYGYAEHVPQDPKLLNCLQRLDFVRVQDCCLMLQGATDFAINAQSGDPYSIARVRELYLESTIDPTTTLDPGTENSDKASADRRHEVKRSRNYLGFFNTVHYIGAIATNDEFDTTRYHDANGNYVVDKTYQENKQEYITADYNESTHEVKEGDYSADITHFDHFKKRNIGTARNMIGINNGYTLKIQNVYTTATTQHDGTFVDVKDHMYYGPVVGVCEVKLLTLVVGEGGGYVYADNVHSDGSKFMNTSGNFVFPGTVDDSNPQYVVDECFPKNFAGTQTSTPHQNPEAYDSERPAHYWYVMGNKYFFTNTITAYTFGDEDFTGIKDLHFDMDNLDQIVTLSGTQKADVVRIKNIVWEHAHDSHYTQPGQSCDIADGTKPGYSLHLSTSESDAYNTNGGYTLLPRTDTYTGVDEYGTLTYDDGNDNGQESPLLAIRLNDSQVNNTENYWRDHLSDPCRVTFDLESGTGDPSNIYTYHVTLKIIYVQGPRVSGKLQIDNCALPGELIHAEAKDLVIETDEAMPVTGTAWRFVNPDAAPDATDEEKYDYVVSYNNYIDHSKADVLAQYRHNGWDLQYVVNAGGNSFPVSLDPLSHFKTVLVHNYHDMSRVNTMKTDLKDKLEPQVGARVYIKNEADLRAFVEYLNSATDDNTLDIPVGLAGIDFILQDNITLTSALTISQAFAGNFHGDGYHINLNGNGTSFLGSNLIGNVYNLGLVGGTIASTGARTNCYELKDDNDLNDSNVLYGSLAYELSHHFTPVADGYVEQYYANGDYQYATTDRAWSLRTDVPNYGSVDTKHITEHTPDVARWKDTDNDGEKDSFVPLYDGTAPVPDRSVDVSGNGSDFRTYYGLPVGYANDYLFFGQHLDKTSADAYPVHIDGVDNDGNRVYETAGYYQSSTDQKFYYNKDAWALQPTLTAIDYTNMTAESDDAKTVPTAFSVADGVTQNLLVYNSGENVFDDGVYVDNTPESDIIYHSIVGGNINYFHLVDKQDFWCPIEFTVNTRAWYERLPHTWRTVPTAADYVYGNAWEGISLPFTVKEVKGEEDGNVVSHFYGVVPNDATPATNDRTLHHEYWLTGMVNASGETTTFARPAVSGDGLFKQTGQDHGNYVFENTYYKTLPDYYDHYTTRDDAEWYAQPHTFADYVYLSKNIPYLIAFPGESFYEFDLTDQVMTFEGGNGVQIPVSTEGTTTVGDVTHHATYLHRTSGLAVNDEGTAFEDAAALPFRTYLTTASSARRYAINSIDNVSINGNDNDDESAGMEIYLDGRTLVVKADFETELPIYHTNGAMQLRLHVEPGITRHTLSPGIYIVQGRKFICM